MRSQRSSAGALALLAALAVLAPAPARSGTPDPTPTWRRIGPPAVSGACMAFDPNHRRFLLFGGETHHETSTSPYYAVQMESTTYVADLAQGQPWTALTLDPAPTGRADAFTIYDAKRDRFIVAGGRTSDGFPTPEVWSFEFTPTPHWTLLNATADIPEPVNKGFPAFFQFDPSPTTPALYDSLGDQMVCFSAGKFLKMNLSATPSFTRQSMTNAPFLNGASLVGDFVNGKIYAVQNLDYDPDSLLGVVWEFDTTNHNTWVRHDGVGENPGRKVGVAATFDAANNRIVLAAGYYSNWGQLYSDPRPLDWQRSVYAFALDGSDAWTRTTYGGINAPPCTDAASAFDRVTRSLLVTGGFQRPESFGLGDEWDLGQPQAPELYALPIDSGLDSDTWSPPGVTAPRDAMASAIDIGRRHWFLYGGHSSSVGPTLQYHDLLEASLDAPGGWKRIGDAPGPTFDDGVMTLFGPGLLLVGGNPLEAWTMDVSGLGRTWVRIAETGPQPPSRVGATMVYDPVRARALLFGGGGVPAENVGEVWTISPGDATPQWQLLAVDPAQAGPSAGYLASVWDPLADRMISIVTDPFDPGSAVYALDCTVAPPLWRTLHPTGTPWFTPWQVAGYDGPRNRVLLFGGLGFLSETGSEVHQLSLEGEGAWSTVVADGPPSPGRFIPVGAFDSVLDRFLVASSEYVFDHPLTNRGYADNQVYALCFDNPTPVLLSFADATVLGDGAVRVRWAGADGASSLAVWRRAAGGSPEYVGDAQLVGPALYEFVDRLATAGARYGYKLALSGGGFTEEAWVDVPGSTLAFAFAPVRPNPSAGAWTVSWTLPRSGAVSLRVHDVRGREVLRRDWASLEAGRYVFAVGDGEGIAPGVYFLTLRQGSLVARQRAVRVGD